MITKIGYEDVLIIIKDIEILDALKWARIILKTCESRKMLGPNSFSFFLLKL